MVGPLTDRLVGRATWALAMLLGGAGCIVRSPTSSMRTGGNTPDPMVASRGGPRAVGPRTLPTPPGPGGLAKPGGAPGNLTVLNWAGFKAAVSYTFDDGNSSQISNYAQLNALGVPMTFYLTTGKPEAMDPIWSQAVKDGHEIGNHSQSHAHDGTAADIDAAATFIQQHLGTTAYTMASPFGDGSYIPIAESRYLANRGVADGQVIPNDSSDPFNLFCFVPATGAPASIFNAQIDTLRQKGGWTTVLVHGFTGGTDGAYQPVSLGEFVASVGYAKALGDVWIGTVLDIAAYWRAQKMFNALTPTASGNDKTWSWTLPAHFPPGKLLRVRIDGGTLTQGGNALPWNEHGYYEVALDAGSLTLSP